MRRGVNARLEARSSGAISPRERSTGSVVGGHPREGQAGEARRSPPGGPGLDDDGALPAHLGHLAQVSCRALVGLEQLDRAEARRALWSDVAAALSPAILAGWIGRERVVERCAYTSGRSETETDALLRRVGLADGPVGPDRARARRALLRARERAVDACGRRGWPSW